MGQQFDIDAFLNASTTELEKLPWYEMISKMGLSSFNWSGTKPIEMIAELTQINANSKILMVGCGAGGTSIYLSEHTQAEIWGIDIAPESIRKAEEASQKSSQSKRIHFQIADAHHLPFETNFFDVVITEFMAFFLKPEAFKEFYRVLKANGTLALAELMLDDAVNPKTEQRILDMEKVYSELVGYSFHIPKVSHYHKFCSDAEFKDIRSPQKFPTPRSRDMLEIVGGKKVLFKMLIKIIKLMRESPILKKRFMMNGEVKKVMIRDKRTAKFIQQALLIAKKRN